jgi:hypothetical protein
MKNFFALKIIKKLFSLYENQIQSVEWNINAIKF